MGAGGHVDGSAFFRSGRVSVVGFTPDCSQARRIDRSAKSLERPQLSTSLVKIALTPFPKR